MCVFVCEAENLRNKSEKQIETFPFQMVVWVCVCV